MGVTAFNRARRAAQAKLEEAKEQIDEAFFKGHEVLAKLDTAATVAVDGFADKAAELKAKLQEALEGGDSEVVEKVVAEVEEAASKALDGHADGQTTQDPTPSPNQDKQGAQKQSADKPKRGRPTAKKG